MKVSSFVRIASIAAALCTTTLGYGQEPIKVGVSFQELNNQYFVTMKNALQSVAGQRGVKLIFTDAHHDVLKQTSDVEDLLQQKIKILLLNPTDTVGIESAVKSAKAAGVIVSCDRRECEGSSGLLRWLEERRSWTPFVRVSGQSYRR